jgi:hypothetical protein
MQHGDRNNRLGKIFCINAYRARYDHALFWLRDNEAIEAVISQML